MKAEYDIFYTFQAGGLDIYRHSPTRFEFEENRGQLRTIETPTAIYYCKAADYEAAAAKLRRNAERSKKR